MRALALAVLFVTSGCGVEVCTRSQRINDGWRTRHAACFTEGAEPPPKFDFDVCTASMKPCSDSDERRLQTYLDCLEALAVCTPERRADFSAEVMACTNAMNPVSDGCYLR